ncbi:MAG: toprim domain-containing protein, partial [Clostridiales Family XIII bacterium]|nr:toprim domain-containing protein [Clostridiales Family XIII bacterium]
FLKKNNLYAIDITKDEIVKEGFSILVEGYMDVISLYQHGVRNVTASLGTALTAAQARVLKRYANNTILAYDADAAGVDAALRGMDLLRDAGLRVKVLVLSDTKDPDEFVRKYGRDAFLDAAKEAVPFIDFKLSVARKRHDLTAAEGSVAFLREAAGILRKLSPVESDYYIKKLSEDTGIGEGAIRTETWGDHASGSVAAGGAGGASRGAPYGAPYGAPNGGPEFERNPHGGAVPRRGGADANGGGPVDEAALAIQRNLIRLVLYDGAFLEEVRPYDGIFVTPPLYRIFKGVTALAARDPGADIDRKALDEILDDEAGRALADIMERVLLGEDPARQLDDCIAQMKIRTLSEREREIRDVLGIGAEGDAHTSDLMKQLKEVQDLIFEIKDR